MCDGALKAARTLAVVVVAGIGLVGCAGSAPVARQTAGDPAATILSAPVEPTSFAQVRSAVLALYQSHRSIGGFSARDVAYTPATRDKVLRVCREAGPEKTAPARESVRVLACAPLIFFFYSYGRQASVPESVAVARTLYWYAVTHNRAPDALGPGLTHLLRSWGVA